MTEQKFNNGRISHKHGFVERRFTVVVHMAHVCAMVEENFNSLLIIGSKVVREAIWIHQRRRAGSVSRVYIRTMIKQLFDNQWLTTMCRVSQRRLIPTVWNINRNMPGQKSLNATKIPVRRGDMKGRIITFPIGALFRVCAMRHEERDDVAVPVERGIVEGASAIHPRSIDLRATSN